MAALPDSSQVEGSRIYHSLNNDLNSFVAAVLTSYWFVLAFLAAIVEYRLTWWRLAIVLVLAFALGYFLKRLPTGLLMRMYRAIRLIRNQTYRRCRFSSLIQTGHTLHPRRYLDRFPFQISSPEMVGESELGATWIEKNCDQYNSRPHLCPRCFPLRDVNCPPVFGLHGNFSLDPPCT